MMEGKVYEEKSSKRDCYWLAADMGAWWVEWFERWCEAIEADQ